MTHKMKLYSVEYYGCTVMDKRFSKPMLPWIIAEIKRRKHSEKICLGVQNGFVHAFNLDLNAGQHALYQHALSLITRFSHSYDSHCTFMYLLRDAAGTLSCHLYQAEHATDVVELFTSMKEQTWKETSMAAPLNARTQSNASQLTSLCTDISPSSSHFFEVLYIGKIKVSHKKVPDSFIDDALEKFKVHELEKERLKTTASSTSSTAATSGSHLPTSTSASNIATLVSSSSSTALPPGGIVITLCKDEETYRRDSQDSTVSDTGDTSVTPTVLSPAIEEDHHKTMGGSVETLAVAQAGAGLAQAGVTHEASKEVSSSPMRNRAASTGSVRDMRKEPVVPHDHNRTMLFLVGRTDLRLISPDRKQILLHKNLRDVAKCIQGVRHADHFGFICREANVECFIGYVFKCQSESFADDVVGAITQAFQATAESLRRDRDAPPVFSCEHCPMVWYHKLCTEVEGLNDKRTEATIFRRLETLPEEEQSSILCKFHGADLTALREQNEFLMMLLRAHCEQKQSRHAHDTAENRSEFLNQYLGGGGTIFMKAKRSLTSSFDQLLKRKGSRDDFGPILKELSLPSNATLVKDPSQHSSNSSLADCSTTEAGTGDGSAAGTRTRKRSSTLGSLDGETMKRELRKQHANHPANQSNTSSNSSLNGHLKEASSKATPMMNIFMKVGSQPKTPPQEANQDTNSRHPGSWRQAIYNRVVTPNKNIDEEPKLAVKRDKAELRSLWRKAINQQLILIRMEKENARLTARQEEATVKRIKLEYDEISACVREVSEVWDLLVSKESRVSAKCDMKMLLQAIKQGVPRSKRGDVWQFLAEQHCLKLGPVDVTHHPTYAVPYDILLKQLTSHQHGILIDLGRTFPGHAYFASPLGPGQLALFNLLKAYSLLDPEVGYCQGLSFVAGILLLHMAESQAFFLLRHLMFRRGLRKQYLPDMCALQVQLYQLSRLLHDRLPEIDAHFDTHEIAPTLYAAPWLLTLFASQFPLGFVTRVFDLLFLFGQEVIFRVSVALLGEHKDGLLECQSFEEIMDYLKTTLPAIDKPMLDRIMKQVFAMDVSKQLREYEVEYQVLQEEMSAPRADPEEIDRLEREKQVLASQNQALLQQLQIATSNVQRLETTRLMQQTSINRLESQVRSLEVSVAAMGSFLSELVDTKTDIDPPGDVRRIMSQLDVAYQRRNSQNNGILVKSPKGVPLRVINDMTEEDYYIPQKTRSNAESKISLKPVEEKIARTPHVLKTALSSPNLSLKLSGMSNFFHNHTGSGRTPTKAFLSPNDTVLEVREEKEVKPVQGSAPVKSNSDGNRIELVSPPRGLSETRDVTVGFVKPKLGKSQSSFELGVNKLVAKNDSGDSGNVTPTSPSVHPLDCSGVNFNYGGTTKLKTIRPLRANLTRNASSDSITVKRGSAETDLLSIDETNGGLTTVGEANSLTAR